MKLLCLNTWGGRAGNEELVSFLDKYKKRVHIFCLQEIWSIHNKKIITELSNTLGVVNDNIMHDGLEKINYHLTDFKSYFHPNFDEHYGLLTLIKKRINMLEFGDHFVHKHKGYIPDNYFGHHARNIQYFIIENGKQKVLIINFHGLWNGLDKKDSEDRIRQTLMIKDFIKGKNIKSVILCGDFNLMPDTKSMQLLENAGLTNLIKKYNIKSTRSKFYTKKEKFADYIFVSKNIEVKSFRVLKDEVSDHLALFLDFNIKTRSWLFFWKK